MQKIKCQSLAKPIRRETRSLAIKYIADGFERIFVVNFLGITGNVMWTFRDGKIHLYERKWIIRMVSIETTQEIAWGHLL